MRPDELAQDSTLDLPVFQHALAWLIGEACAGGGGSPAPDIAGAAGGAGGMKPCGCY